jgi:diguanylate cyclase (GGDEF)-like protein
LTILVADDDPVSRRLLEATVTRLGHEPIAVADGRHALEVLLAPDRPAPRLAILDWDMPEIDGIEVCRQVRQRPTPYVYIVMLTARERREDMLRALAAESDEFLTKPFDPVELQARLRSGERILTLQQDLLNAHQALQFEADHDALTGLLNRGAIIDLLDREASRMSREGRALGVALIDVDLFKRINDTLGHLAGDDVLRGVAQRMVERARAHEAIGRYGGEEFLMVLPGAEGPAATRVAERLRRAVAARPFTSGGTKIPVTTSIGIAWSPNPAGRVEALVHLADAALYQAKSSGRNRVELAGRDTPVPPWVNRLKLLSAFAQASRE